jgi:retron-type reverse transcriptase
MQNIWQAGHCTLLCGRRFRNEGAKFKLYYEKHLLQIHTELATKTYTHGAYKSFMIYEPKQREVLAAPIKDRIVHHAVHDTIEPVIDRKFIFDSYACRKNKGTHAAIIRTQRFMQANEYFMHLDVKKYFPNINHNTLKTILKRHIKEQDVLELFYIIINSTLPDNNAHMPDLFSSGRIGLPIGNLTSQFLANLYLNELDQYVKHELKIKHYIRYMDDFVVFGNDKAMLKQWEKDIVLFCKNKLQLALHIKGGIKHYYEGLGFLGFKIYRKHKLLKSVCLNRYMQKYKRKQKELSANKIDENDLQRSVDTWQNHISFANTYRLRNFLRNKYSINLTETAHHE